MPRCRDCFRSRCVCPTAPSYESYNQCDGSTSCDSSYIVQRGSTGPAGPAGTPGTTGPTGPQGIAGTIGSQIYIGTLNNAPSNPPNNSINVDPNTGIIYQYNGVWSQRMSIAGTTGPTGPSSPITSGNLSGTSTYVFAGADTQALVTFNYTNSTLKSTLLSTTWSMQVESIAEVTVTGYTTVDATTYSTAITIPASSTYDVAFSLNRIIMPAIGTHTIVTGFDVDTACTVRLIVPNGDVTTYLM